MNDVSGGVQWATTRPHVDPIDDFINYSGADYPSTGNSSNGVFTSNHDPTANGPFTMPNLNQEMRFFHGTPVASNGPTHMPISHGHHSLGTYATVTVNQNHSLSHRSTEKGPKNIDLGNGYFKVERLGSDGRMETIVLPNSLNRNMRMHRAPGQGSYSAGASNSYFATASPALITSHSFEGGYHHPIPAGQRPIRMTDDEDDGVQTRAVKRTKRGPGHSHPTQEAPVRSKKPATKSNTKAFKSKQKAVQSNNKIAAAKKSNTTSAHQPSTTIATYDNHPSYTPEPALNSAEACVALLARPSPEELHQVEFTKPAPEDKHGKPMHAGIPLIDDWKTVADQGIQHFTGQIYDSLLHPFVEQKDPKVIGPNNERRYIGQQNAAMDAVGEHLSTVHGIMRAKAQCQLMVHRVVLLHKEGVLKGVFDGYTECILNKRTVERQYKLDLGLICSERLTEVVKIVKASKLVAGDILAGKNFDQIARDPKFYLQHKYTLLKSNSTRQKKTNKSAALEKAMKKAGRAAQLEGSGNVTESEDDDDDDGTYHP